MLLAALSVLQRHVVLAAITGREGCSGGPKAAASISDLAVCTLTGAFIGMDVKGDRREQELVEQKD